MLALQTDMSIPKDVNRIRLQVLVGAKLQHDETYPVAPEPHGTKLPATLAIVAGEDENPTVQVRVIGIRDDAAGVLARTFAKVVTTVPKSRIATLRVPIQWLCDETAKEVGNEEYESTCPNDGDDEQSCVAGECKSVLVDSDLLPDYTPEDIFGGDPGPDGFFGVCFDTVPCFDAGFDAVPNDDCELELDVPEGGDVNVGLRFPTEVDDEEGTGICGEEACYVPLDQDATYGWRLTGPGSGSGGEGNADEDGEGGDGFDGGPTTVKLPASVCDRLDEGSVEAVRVSYACQTKTPKYPTCGPWSAVEEGTVVDGAGGNGTTGVIANTTTGAGGTGNVVGECASLTGDSIDTGDPGVDQYVSAVRQLVPFAEQYRDMTEQACAALLHQTPVGDLDDAELAQLCQDASGAVSDLVGSGGLHLVLAEGYCVSDMATQLGCEDRCGSSEACGGEQDFRCTSLVGDCPEGGSCTDGCYGDSEAPTACVGTCFGECTGGCSGRCTLADGSVATEACTGMCQGTCNGTCVGNCVNTTDCNTTCRASAPDDVCGGAAENLTCRTPLSTETCAEDLCAVSCALESAVTHACKISVVSSYPAASDREPVSQADRTLLETNLGPLSDVVLQTQDLDTTLEQLSIAIQALGEQVADDPNYLDPEATVCLSEALALHSQAIAALNLAVANSAAVLDTFYFTDVSVGGGGTNGTGGTDSNNSAGGTGGGTGGTGGETGGAGGTGGGTGGTGGDTGGEAGVGGVPPDGGTSGGGGTAGTGGGGGTAGGGGTPGTGGTGGGCSFVYCTSDADCGTGVCPLGTCDVALTACGVDSDCPEDVCDGICTVTGTGCETDGECNGPDTCSPRFCDCSPGSGGTAGVDGSGGAATSTGGAGGTLGGSSGAGGTAGTSGAGGTVGGSSGAGGVGGMGGTAGSAGSAGSAGTAGFGGNGGFGGSGGSFGGFGGNGASGGSGGSGGSSTTGAANCGYGADPDPCEICLAEICCGFATACDTDPICGPVNSPDSEVQCVVDCQGGYGFPTTECEAICGQSGNLTDAAVDLLSCGSECFDCTVPNP